MAVRATGRQRRPGISGGRGGIAVTRAHIAHHPAGAAMPHLSSRTADRHAGAATSPGAASAPAPSLDAIDRRGLLKCMAWAGTGLLWSLEAGTAKAMPLTPGASRSGGGLFFVQVSDSHIGFNKAANPDVTQTLRAAVAKINALPRRPDFVVHTGDVSHLSRPDEFDLADQVLKGIHTERVLHVPGEHDVIGDNGRQFFARYGHAPSGWYSFDLKGVHFIALVNVLNFKDRGLGNLGPAQLEWLKRDVQGLSSSTPIVVFAHMPLWTIYPDWGWGTADSAQALAHLERFGSLTVLNGHIHQVLQKVEGHVTFHTALSTAYPQPAPGAGPGPGPLVVPAGQLGHMLGIREVDWHGGAAPELADSTLAEALHAARS
jgi:hypothetical protein